MRGLALFGVRAGVVRRAADLAVFVRLAADFALFARLAADLAPFVRLADACFADDFVATRRGEARLVAARLPDDFLPAARFAT